MSGRVRFGVVVLVVLLAQVATGVVWLSARSDGSAGDLAGARAPSIRVTIPGIGPIALGSAGGGRWQERNGQIEATRLPTSRAALLVAVAPASVGLAWGVSGRSVSTKPGTGLVIRYRDASNFWALRYGADFASWLVERVEGGMVTYVGTIGPAAIDPEQVVTLETEGPVLRVILGGRKAFELTDPFLSTERGFGVSARGTEGGQRWADLRVTKAGRAS